ncbi:SIS domain-containing protein [Xylaria bambusicola]|uniref:SIS domain-containing protein n=1 Tax=Xylaria bambusicola TaxID=326684 RepID=UPI002008A8E3|nr:SIS domain-containing protein [Xylaria bambusicola]KAI0528164.1 SIS domain-containing protein [Xylaria bambusicola]
MVEHHPVHNSEVYLLGLAPRPSVPPPSPPSPLTPTDAGSSTPIEHLCLEATTGPSADVVEEASSVAGRRLAGAIHVLNTEATALRSLTQLYKVDATAAEGFNAAVDAILRQCHEKGKLVVTGVGKSGLIGRKIVATFNSLGLHSTFLHPTEALHGDLGKVGAHDVILFITFSGKTSELLTLLPHVDASLPVIVLTAHSQPTDCELIRHRPGAILLPATIHESETVSFGISAPTTSTTVALAVGDALGIVVSQELHASVSSVFARNHPGGAIGAAFKGESKKPGRMRDLAVPFEQITSVSGAPTERCGADVLKAGYESPSGWVSVGEALACPVRIRRLSTELMMHALPEIPDLLVPRSEWINISADTRIAQAVRWIQDLLVAPELSETACGEDSILAVVDTRGEVIGVLEAGALLRWCES